MNGSALYITILLAGTMLASWAITLIIRRAALARCLMDTPNERSCHTAPTPRGGGAAFVISFVAACIADMALGGTFDSPSPGLALAILGPLAALGFTDDIRDLSARVRLPLHLLIGGLVLVLFPNAAEAFGGSLPGVTLVAALIVVGTAALINFYNFMDGTDALVAGCFIVQALFFSAFLGQGLWLPAAAAVTGFLYWNRPPAKIFMGDAGSTFLGGAAALAIVAGLDSAKPALAALAVTLPLTGDATYTIVRRLFMGENIFTAHRQHIYQRLHVLAGWSHGQLAFTYALLTLAFGAAVLFFGAAGSWAALGAAAALIPIAELRIARGAKSKG